MTRNLQLVCSENKFLHPILILTNGWNQNGENKDCNQTDNNYEKYKKQYGSNHRPIPPFNHEASKTRTNKIKIARLNKIKEFLNTGKGLACSFRFLSAAKTGIRI
jgi:hypothetical protein